VVQVAGVSPEPSLYEFLTKNEFYLSPELAQLVEKVVTTPGARKAFLLRGPAGVGKTQLTYLVARYLDAEYVFYQCTYGVSEDDLLYKYIPSKTSRSGIKITLGPIPRALSLSKNRKVVLVLDEFDKTRPSADALLLDVLQNFRVSLYIDDKETVVYGNPENLVIFLTSNDMREFSEPLLRRVIAITLEPLPTSKVFELLSKRFRKETALLLAQIYEDTINAQLRKPATIQELVQLGELIEAGVNLPLESLLRMFVVKYEDDWRKFTAYIASRKAYEFVRKPKEAEDLAKYYEPSEPEVKVEEPEASTTATTVASVLDKLAKLVVARPEALVAPQLSSEEGASVVTFKAEMTDENPDAYTTVVKHLRPEPAEDGSRVGKFEVRYLGEDKFVMFSKEPLTLEEYKRLVEGASRSFEAYVEDTVEILSSAVVDLLIKEAKSVYYYSKNLVRLALKTRTAEELVEVRLEEPYSPSRKYSTFVRATFRVYGKVDPPTHDRTESALLSILTNQCRSKAMVELSYLPEIVRRCEDFKVKVDATAEEVAKLLEGMGLRVNLSTKPNERPVLVEKGFSVYIYDARW
jgi:MoxR-like ATPase